MKSQYVTCGGRTAGLDPDWIPRIAVIHLIIYPPWLGDLVALGQVPQLIGEGCGTFGHEQIDLVRDDTP
jgi:hypothetical protein